MSPNQKSRYLIFFAIGAAIFWGSGLIWSVQTLATDRPEAAGSQSSQPDEIQVVDTSKQESADLPEHAIWRFGEHDHSPDANGVYRLQYSSDGRLLAVRNRNNVVAIHDIQKRKKLCEIDGGDGNWVVTIDFSPDSKFFMTAAGANEKVKIWSSQTGKLESEIDTDATAAYFSQTGDAISVLGETDVETYSWPGVQLLEKKRWKNDNDTRAAMSKDGQTVVVYQSIKHQIYRTYVLDLASTSRIELDGRMEKPKTVVISPNRLWIAIAYHLTDRVHLWDLRDPHQKKYILKEHNEAVQSLCFSTDNRFLTSSSWDQKIIAWDVLTRQPIGEFVGHSEQVNATSFSPLDLTFASGASGVSDCSTIIWNLGERLIRPVDDPADDFEKIWAGLGAKSIDISLRASSTLIASGDLLIDRLEERIGKSVTDQTLGKVRASINLLSNPEYDIRQQATEELIKIRSYARPQIQQALKTATSPEMRYRLGLILKSKLARPPRPVEEIRRWHRLIFSLEQINSDRAQRLLKKISEGHQDIDIANDARDSYRRNQMRQTQAALSRIGLMRLKPVLACP